MIPKGSNSYARIQSDVDKAIGPQKSFAKDIEKVWKVELRQDVRAGKRDMSFIDYMLIEPKTDNVLGYVELKNRTVSSTMFPDLMIDHKKMVEIRKKATFSGMPVYLAIRYTDRDLVYEYNPQHRFRIEHGGRTTNTRHAYDIKEVEYIPMKNFRLLENIR